MQNVAPLFCLHPGFTTLPRFVLVTFPFVNQKRDFQEGLLYTELITHLSKSTTLKGT